MVKESSPIEIEPTSDNVAARIGELDRALAAIREASMTAEFQETRALFESREPDLDVRIIEKLFNETVPVLQGLMAKKESARPQTLPGVRPRVATLKSRIVQLRDFLAKDVNAAIAKDMDQTLARKKSLETIGVAEIIAKKSIEMVGTTIPDAIGALAILEGMANSLNIHIDYIEHILPPRTAESPAQTAQPAR